MQVQYLLDTNICIYIIKYQPEIVRQYFEKHLPHRNILISVITLGELRFGAEKSQHKEKALKVIDELTSMIQVVELDEMLHTIMQKYARTLHLRGRSLAQMTYG